MEMRDALVRGFMTPNPDAFWQLAQYATDALRCAAQITTEVTAVIGDAENCTGRDAGL